jgi:hypothetical protein
MARGRRHTPEQIVNALPQIEVAIANRQEQPGGMQGGRDYGTALTYYRWRMEYGGLKVDKAKRLK